MEAKLLTHSGLFKSWQRGDIGIYELCVLHGQGIEENLLSNLSVGSFQDLEDKNG